MKAATPLQMSNLLRANKKGWLDRGVRDTTRV
jgi:hypothetical protein